MGEPIQTRHLPNPKSNNVKYTITELINEYKPYSLCPKLLIIKGVYTNDIKVLDMPLLDTRESEGSLDKRFIADLVLQILSYVAQKELENNKKRQQQGIAVMPVVNGKKVRLKTGKATGRPEATYPKEWERYYQEWRKGNITAKRCIEELGLKRATFYKLVSKYESAYINIEETHTKEVT